MQNLKSEKHTFLSITNKSDTCRNDITNKEAGHLTPERQQGRSPITSGHKKVASNDTVILDDSLAHELLLNEEHNTIVIADSGDEAEVEKSRNKIATAHETKTTTPKKSKKKLFPLRENSRLLSLTPVEEPSQSPKQLLFTKRRKRPKKKILKNISYVENERSNLEGVTECMIEASVEEDHMFRDKGKEQKKKRKILSKKIVINKHANEDILRKLQENGRDISEARQRQTNTITDSLNDFRVDIRTAAQSQRHKLRKIVIVATGLSKEDKSLVKSVVNGLGKAKLELNVSRRTTHVVSTGVRTINLLHGIIRGCWLVSLEWVLKSLENKSWLDPENYEMSHFSKAVQENRKDRQLFGSAYTPELFAACGFIHVENGTKPPCNVLKDLIKTAGGHITENPRIAKIVIGTEGLKESWVLDCITTGELQPCNQYRRN